MPGTPHRLILVGPIKGPTQYFGRQGHNGYPIRRCMEPCSTPNVAVSLLLPCVPTLSFRCLQAYLCPALSIYLSPYCFGLAYLVAGWWCIATCDPMDTTESPKYHKHIMESWPRGVSVDPCIRIGVGCHPPFLNCHAASKTSCTTYCMLKNDVPKK